METIKKVIKNLKLILQNRGWIEDTAKNMVENGYRGSGFGMVAIDGLNTADNKKRFGMHSGVCHNADLYSIDDNQFVINGEMIDFNKIKNAKTNYLRDHLEQMYVCIRDNIDINVYFDEENYSHPTFFINGNWASNEMWLEKDRWFFVEFCLKELEHLRDHGEMINHE